MKKDELCPTDRSYAIDSSTSTTKKRHILNATSLPSPLTHLAIQSEAQSDAKPHLSHHLAHRSSSPRPTRPAPTTLENSRHHLHRFPPRNRDEGHSRSGPSIVPILAPTLDKNGVIHLLRDAGPLRSKVARLGRRDDLSALPFLARPDPATLRDTDVPGARSWIYCVRLRHWKIRESWVTSFTDLTPRCRL